jgi:hypothetical protein
MELHECDDEEILEAIFEAIAYEKDAEAELGVYAYDQRRDMNMFKENFLADRFAEMIYKFGCDLYRELKMHRLYMNGFLPYQYMKRHGDDLVVHRLDVPSIQHRDNVLHGDRSGFQYGLGVPAFAATLLGALKKPTPEEDKRLDALIRKFGEVPQSGTPEEVLGPMAQAFKDFHTATDPVVAAPLTEPDAVEKFRQEMEAIFGQLKKTPAPQDYRTQAPQSYIDVWIRWNAARWQAELDGTYLCQTGTRTDAEIAWRALNGDKITEQQLAERLDQRFRLVPEESASAEIIQHRAELLQAITDITSNKTPLRWGIARQPPNSNVRRSVYLATQVKEGENEAPAQ